jgi:hypothetical protein
LVLCEILTSLHYDKQETCSAAIVHVKVKVKLSLCFNWAPRNEGVLGSGGIAPCILDLCTRWRWVVSFTPRRLYPQGKRPWYPLDRRLGGPQTRSERGCKEINSPPTGTRACSPALYHWAIPALCPTVITITKLTQTFMQDGHKMELSSENGPVKGKGKFLLVLIFKLSTTKWRRGGISPGILDLCTRWRWVVSFTFRSLYPQRRRPWYPSDRRLGGPQSRSGRGGEEKNSQPLPGPEPPIIRPIVQRYTTELCRRKWAS